MSAPRFEPGEIVVARVIESVHGDNGKTRPALLVDAAEVAGWWRVLSFTTLDRHANGEARVAVPSPERMGLLSAGYLWSGATIPVPRSACTAHIGWATDELVDVVTEALRLSPWELSELRPQARADRRRSRRRVA